MPRNAGSGDPAYKLMRLNMLYATRLRAALYNAVPQGFIEWLYGRIKGTEANGKPQLRQGR